MATDTILRPRRIRLIRPPRLSASASALVFVFWFYYELHSGLPLLLSSDLARVTLINASVSAFILLVLVGYALRRQGSLLPWPRNKVIYWAFGFLAWSGASLLWTFADSRISAVGYWGETTIMVLSVVLMFRFGDREQLAVRSLQGIFCGMTLLVTLLLITGTFSDGRLGDPELLHPNSLGRDAAIALFAGTYLFRMSPPGAKRILVGIGWVVLFTGLVATFSKTSIAAFFFGMIVYGMLEKPVGMRLRIIGVLIMAGLLALPYTTSKLEEYSRSQSGHAVETISGRTPLWNDTWQMIQQRPVIGYGYLSFRDYGPQVFNVRVVHAHNELLNIWFTLGLVGLVITVGLYISYFRIGWKARKSSQSVLQANLALALLALCLVRSLTEADMRSLVFQLPLMVLIAGWTYTAMKSVPQSMLRKDSVQWIDPLAARREDAAGR